MITTEQFLRRSLMAPILVPLIVGCHAWMQSLKQGTSFFAYSDNLWLVIGQTIATVSGLALLFGFVPYIWMLFVKREELREQTGAELEHTIKMFPFTMIPYFLKAMIIPSVICLFIPYFFWMGPVLALIGTLATIAVGYIYVGITFCFLRLFQSLQIVE